MGPRKGHPHHSVRAPIISSCDYEEDPSRRRTMITVWVMVCSEGHSRNEYQHVCAERSGMINKSGTRRMLLLSSSSSSSFCVFPFYAAAHPSSIQQDNPTTTAHFVAVPPLVNVE
mmetsp:Transcript_28110/g.45260  ORF Transcript_28110/g.45260 Transcript_28110/m.45260 type:complete len:115 (-) Transcript_28110:141-485(-)